MMSLTNYLRSDYSAEFHKPALDKHTNIYKLKHLKKLDYLH